MSEWFVSILSGYSWAIVSGLVIIWSILRCFILLFNYRARKFRKAKVYYRFVARSITGRNYKSAVMRLNLYSGVTLLILAALILASVFLNAIRNWPINPDPMEWGVIGDFFGGMLNPILAFASFIALLYTIRIQSEELRLTRDELSKSVVAQQQLVDSQNAQTSFSASLEDYNSIRQLLVATLTELRANFYSDSEAGQNIRSLRAGYQVFELKKEIDLTKCQTQIEVWSVISSDFRAQFAHDMTLSTRGTILCNLAYDALRNYENISSIANSKLKGHFQASLKSYAESVAIYIVFAKLFAPKAKYGKSEIRCKMLFEEIERICRDKELPAPPVTLFSAGPAFR